ncbi:hypothetical protein Tco_0317576 [Tanacetum coccineum]
MESIITKLVSKEIQSSMPVLINEALKQELPSLLTDALKSTLPTLLKDLIKESVDTSVEKKLPVFNEEVHKSLKSPIPELFIQPINKELIAFNKMEANRFVHLQEELSKVIQQEVGKKVKTKVRTWMHKVTERLDTLVTSATDNSDSIYKLKQQMTELVSLLHSVEVLKKTNAEGEKSDQSKGTNTKEKEQPKQATVQGEQQDNTADQTST